MKRFFLKQNRIYGDLSPRGKKESIILNIASIVLYVASAFAFFECLYLICNMIGSVVCASAFQAVDELIRVLPILICFFGLLFISATIHRVTRVCCLEKRAKRIFNCSIASIVIGAAAFIYLIVGLITGTYHSLVEGYPTLLFPLDLMILSLLYIAAGIVFIYMVKKVMPNKQPSEIPLEPRNFSRVRRFFRGLGFVILYMIAVYGFAGFVYGTYTIAWGQGSAFYGVMLLIVYLLPTLMFAAYKFVYIPLKEEHRLDFQFKASAIILGVNVVAFALYMVSLFLAPNAGNDMAFGILPIDFTASVNASTYIYGIALIVPPLVSLLKAVYRKKHQ